MTVTATYMLAFWLLSTVPHLLWEQGVGGSNPLTPTPFFSDEKPSFYNGGFLFLLLKSISYKVINLNQIKSNIPKKWTHFWWTHPLDWTNGRFGGKFEGREQGQSYDFSIYTYSFNYYKCANGSNEKVWFFYWSKRFSRVCT